MGGLQRFENQSYPILACGGVCNLTCSAKMEDNPLEPYLSIIRLLTTFIGQYCAEFIIADMSSDSTGSFQWSPDERATLILFLVKEKHAGKLGKGGFKAATLNAAAAHQSS